MGDSGHLYLVTNAIELKYFVRQRRASTVCKIKELMVRLFTLVCNSFFCRLFRVEVAEQDWRQLFSKQLFHVIGDGALGGMFYLHAGLHSFLSFLLYFLYINWNSLLGTF